MAAIDARRALALVGVPFRLQGRDASGLDCVGLCLAAFRIPPQRARADYQLRGDFRSEIKAFLATGFRDVGGKRLRPGDLMVMQVSEQQSHLGIRTKLGFVHADAGLRRVVETPGEPPWPQLAVYRRIVSRRGR